MTAPMKTIAQRRSRDQRLQALMRLGAASKPPLAKQVGKT